jgi:hypothetical protein
VTGSLSLRGARIDDLFLTGYQETNEEGSPPVELFRPEGMRHAYQAQFGWNGPNVPGGVPGPMTPWRLTEGATLTPTTPVTLTWDNGAGLRFTRRIAVDAQYLFTVTDTVANFSAQPITIAPWGRIERQGVPDSLGRQQVLHEGGIGTFAHGREIHDPTAEIPSLGQEAGAGAHLHRRLDGHHRQILAGRPDPAAGRADRGRLPRHRRRPCRHPLGHHAGRGAHHRARPPDHRDPAPVRRRQAQRDPVRLREEPRPAALHLCDRLGLPVLPDPPDLHAGRALSTAGSATSAWPSWA